MVGSSFPFRISEIVLWSKTIICLHLMHSYFSHKMCLSMQPLCKGAPLFKHKKNTVKIAHPRSHKHSPHQGFSKHSLQLVAVLAALVGRRLRLGHRHRHPGNHQRSFTLFCWKSSEGGHFLEGQSSWKLNLFKYSTLRSEIQMTKPTC